MVAALDRALTPMGVRATRDAKGELAFNVSEKDWPQVRDSLAIRGGGRRFPTGQFNHVRTVVAEQAIQPSPVEMQPDPRKALQDIAQAQQLIRKSYGDVRGVLAEAAAETWTVRPVADARGAYWQGFAEEYADTLAQCRQ